MEDREELSYEEEMHPERRMHPVMRGIAKGLRWFGVAVIVLVVALMLWRINTLERVPSEMQTLLVNEATHAAYVAHGEDMMVYTQEKLDPMTTNREAYGYFWIDQVLIIPEAKQVQVLVKYNNSTLEHLAADYELSSVPAREESILDLSMRIITDTTPNNLEDIEDEKTWIQETVQPQEDVVSGKKDVYNYRKYIFDGVEISSDTIGLKVDFRFVGAPESEEEPLASLYVYYQLADNVTVKLTKNDIAALNAYQNGEKNAEN